MSHGCTKTGAPSEAQWARNVDDPVVVEVAVADVVADLHASHPGGEGALELAAGEVGVLQRHLGDRHEPAAARRAQLEQARR